MAALKKSGMEIGVNVSDGFSNVLAVKDVAARECVTKAADYSAKVLKKFLQPRIEEIIDSEKKIAQSDLADETDDAIKAPEKLGVTAVSVPNAAALSLAFVAEALAGAEPFFSSSSCSPLLLFSISPCS